MSTNLRWVLIARGVLGVVLGVLAIGWPGITVGVVVLLFVVYAFVAAGADLVTAIHVEGVGPTLGYLALAAVSAMAGFAALLWPGATAVLLSWFVAFWALATGIGEIVLATRRGITPGRRAMWVAGGLVSVALGLTLALNPDVGPLALGIVFGVFSTVYGMTLLTRVVTAGGSRPVVAAGERVVTGGRERIDVSFPSGDASCAAWLYLPAPGETPRARRPVVVLGHGLGATRDMSLADYAEAFRADGYACVAFDYRHFGDSGGQPRQLLDVEQELTDWASAIAYARSHPSCDPERVVLWGSSFGGGHALTAAARDRGVAAVIAQCPFTDGIASMLRHDPVASVRVGARAVRDVLGAARGRTPVTVGLVGRRRSAALLTAPDALPGYAALLTPGTTFRNEVAARFAFQLPRYRPGRRLRELRCPVLLCLCSEDSVAPTARTRRYAAGARTQIREYPFGHFGIYTGSEREVVLHDQREFLRREVPSESRPA